MHKTIIIGANGYLGKAFHQAYLLEHPDTIGTDRSVINLSCPELPPIPRDYSYAIIAAGMTNVARCEQYPDLSYQTNVRGTLDLVSMLLEKNITPILFSSDYVFDGKKGGYDETEPQNTLNVYGAHKAELETALEERFPNQYLLIRLSKVYGLTLGDGTLIDQIVSSLVHHKPVRAVFDQTFSPVFLGDVVQAVKSLQTLEARGIYHVSGNEPWNRFEMVRILCKILGRSESLLVPIRYEDLGETFLRPKNIGMRNQKMVSQTKIEMKKLSQAMQEMAELYVSEER
jgi:dTDP-4-dehydrorhamnose reductase